MDDCIFCKIINEEIESKILHKDEDVIAFNDISPQAPVHVLVVPREHSETLNTADSNTIQKCMNVAKELAVSLGIDEDGYRVVINCNKMGGQEVGHLHVHLLGGRQMKWPPG
ncbi:MAG: histidine triad nucleotide-binding protein [Elusimicrobiota bacterium]